MRSAWRITSAGASTRLAVACESSRLVIAGMEQAAERGQRTVHGEAEGDGLGHGPADEIDCHVAADWFDGGGDGPGDHRDQVAGGPLARWRRGEHVERRGTDPAAVHAADRHQARHDLAVRRLPAGDRGDAGRVQPRPGEGEPPVAGGAASQVSAAVVDTIGSYDPVETRSAAAASSSSTNVCSAVRSRPFARRPTSLVPTPPLFSVVTGIASSRPSNEATARTVDRCPRPRRGGRAPRDHPP